MTSSSPATLEVESDVDAPPPRRPLLLALVLALLLVGVVSPLITEPTEPQSSYGYTPSGHRAFLELLQQLGLPAERWQTIPQHLAGTQQALLLLDSFPDLLQDRAAYVEALLAWTRAGNSLLIAPAERRITVEHVKGYPVEVEEPFAKQSVDRVILQALGLTIERSAKHLDHQPCPVTVEQLDGAGVTTLALDQVFAWSGDELVPIVRANDAVLIGEVACGAGKIVLIGTPEIFRNGCIEEGDNATLALQLVSRYGSEHVWIDEFLHGVVASNSLLELATTGPLAPISWTLLATLAAWLWSRAVRFGGPHVPISEPRRSKQEHLTALGEILRRGRKPGMVPGRLTRGLLEDLAERFGLARGTPREQTLAHVRAARATIHPALVAALERAGSIHEHDRMHPRALVDMALQLQHLREDLLHGRS